MSDFPAGVTNQHASSPIILICEHAANFLPEEFGDLGLDREAQNSHIAWDLGAMAVAQNLSKMLDARLIASYVSRLIYDCNRPPSAKNAIPTRSENYQISGNETLSQAEKQRRVELYYEPFRKLLAYNIAISPTSPVLVTIHSFTPVYLGKTREVQLGILHDSDSRLADLMLSHAPAYTELCVKRNEPYGPEDGVTHTLQLHGISNQLANVMIEIVNTEIDTEKKQATIASMLCNLLQKSLTDLNN